MNTDLRLVCRYVLVRLKMMRKRGRRRWRRWRRGKTLATSCVCVFTLGILPAQCDSPYSIYHVMSLPEVCIYNKCELGQLEGHY